MKEAIATPVTFFWLQKYRARKAWRWLSTVTSKEWLRWRLMTWLAGGRPTLMNCRIVGDMFCQGTTGYIYFNNEFISDIEFKPNQVISVLK